MIETRQYLAMGQNLRIMRAKRRLTQEELARRSGVSRSTIIQIEKCEKKNLTVNALIQLADALQVELADFFRTSV